MEDLITRPRALVYPQILSLDPPGFPQGGFPIELLAGAQILVMNLRATPPRGHPILIFLFVLPGIELFLRLPEKEDNRRCLPSRFWEG
jgi:hypothetical protein